MQRTLTYKIPDELYSTSDLLGKTSTQDFNGPDTIILYIDKDNGHIYNSFIPSEEPNAPVPLNINRVVFTATTDEDFVKIALIYGGLDKPKVYEVIVGPADQPNTIVKDPTDLREVYDEKALMENWTAPLQYRINKKPITIDFIKNIRNEKLAASDGKIAPDMPESLKQAWLDYRQKLRDLPVDWADCPTWLIRFPLSPDETIDSRFNDPEVDVIRVYQRTEKDREALLQLPNGAN